MTQKYIYLFAEGKAEGTGTMKDLLGGKGAGLAEMTNAGLPVPPGFTISTQACTAYYASGQKFPEGMMNEVEAALAKTEAAAGKGFGNKDNPLLVSVRSGAKFSMPGMMDTVLNLGLNEETLAGIARLTGNERFAYDAYRRFIQMFGKIVLNIDPEKFEHIFNDYKKRTGATLDTDLGVAALKSICADFKALVKSETGNEFPSDPRKQLEESIRAVFASWNGRRAIDYRRVHKISDALGTAVNICTMVFGNMGNDSGTGVAFTRDPANGARELFGEYLQNAQGEDVVAGIRTPKKIAELHKDMPEIYDQFAEVAEMLERHYKDVQDLEFTIERGKLWMLQTRNAKRTGAAAVKIAVDMVHEGLIDKPTAALRVEPGHLDQLLHPMLDPNAQIDLLATGLPASPGAASGKVVFDPDEAETMAHEGEKVILVRIETSPEDFHGMVAAQAILTARGGMTCIAGETQVLTDRGFITAETAFSVLEEGSPLRILSFDCRTLQPVWRQIIAAGRKPSEVITVAVSQTGRAEQNILRLTCDHKMFTIQNRKLTKKRLDGILADEDFVTVVDQIPAMGETSTSLALAYVVGAILSDGYIKLTPTKGSVTFIQKPTPEKAHFINAVEKAFEEAFGVPFTYIRERETASTLRGREIRGKVEDRISFRREPAARLAEIRDNIAAWVLTLNRSALLCFLAGFVDGDGTYAEESSAVRLQITVSKAKSNHLEGLALACLRLGIVPQVTNNRDHYLVQISEKVEEILAFTHRVQAEIPLRKYESKCFAVKSLFEDIVEQVNYMGRIREGIRRNIIFGAEKLRRDVLPLCPGETYREVQALLDSPLRSYRIVQVGKVEPALVYNFEVDATDDLDKNFVVFSSRLSPILVSNSHAAVVARGMGKCCVAGCGSLQIDYAKAEFDADGRVIRKGDFITLDGTTGRVVAGKVNLIEPRLDENFSEFMTWVDEFRKMRVRTNADTPHDSQVARKFGAEGIGLCRTEHMFFEGNRIDAVREMIVAKTREERERALQKIEPLQREDFLGIFKAMDGYPVTIRTLDPPLHEFLPHGKAEITALAKKLKITVKSLTAKIESLHEANPMLGHRGCRLGIVYPEITEMQARAIFTAAVEATRQGVKVYPEVMIPLVADVKELELQTEVVRRIASEVFAKEGMSVDYLVGTMIELPRAALTADRIAEAAQFFSFGTNDLTQTTYGLSRDDSGRFLPFYVEKKIFKDDPFQVLDQEGVGKLVEMAVQLGRKTRSDLKVGICGEHGGEPSSVIFCHRVGLNYVSCSPYRVPIARLAAAQAVLGGEKAGSHTA